MALTTGSRDQIWPRQLPHCIVGLPVQQGYLPLWHSQALLIHISSLPGTMRMQYLLGVRPGDFSIGVLSLDISGGPKT